MSILSSQFAVGQIKKYCYSNNTGEYAMSLYDDGSKKAVYQLFSTNGNLKKTMVGEWMMLDEGLYGTAYMITITWTGANSGLQDLKFVAQFDGNGKLQGIIDSQSRTWDYCR